jgi:hypothetical protein
MRVIRDSPILTDTYPKASDFRPSIGSTYIFGHSTEVRSEHVKSWHDHSPQTALKQVEQDEIGAFRLRGTGSNLFGLRSETDLGRFWDQHVLTEVAYLDITGLSHSVWAALLRAGLERRRRIIVTYAEPDSYRRSAAPVEGQIYDLSARTNGISPLPGYAVLSERFDQDFILVALLGFEGARLGFMLEQVQPGNNRVIPVIGCPGFKPWYIFEAYVGNKRVLSDTQAWHEALYAPGNCPFSMFYLLEEIAKARGKSALKIALAGTKPHSLGAVLFALSTDIPVELVYDHPTRAEGRTDGTERLLAYHVSQVATHDPLAKRARSRERRSR